MMKKGRRRKKRRKEKGRKRRRTTKSSEHKLFILTSPSNLKVLKIVSLYLNVAKNQSFPLRELYLPLCEIAEKYLFCPSPFSKISKISVPASWILNHIKILKSLKSSIKSSISCKCYFYKYHSVNIKILSFDNFSKNLDYVIKVSLNYYKKHMTPIHSRYTSKRQKEDRLQQFCPEKLNVGWLMYSITDGVENPVIV